MSRILTVGAAQTAAVGLTESRAQVVERLLALMREAHARGCDLVVYTECALTPFFPHWLIEDERELDAYFEREMPGRDTQPLFDQAARLGIGFCLGFAEMAHEGGRRRRYNTCVLAGKDGRVIGKYRKIHLPGYHEAQPEAAWQDLEKRYFDVGDLGFGVWEAFGGRVGMCICYDRRFPESYRVLSLKGAELILIGYNTPARDPEKPELDRLTGFHNLLCMQSGAYNNGAWVVGVAKAGCDAGVDMIGQSTIIAPSGEIMAMTAGLGDELLTWECDLDQTRLYRDYILDLANMRRPEHYAAITAPTSP
jgi:predicted amidohydrolase